MNHNKKFLAALTALSAALLFSHASMAAVSADQAATLKSTLTPLGGERAGNADGSVLLGLAVSPKSMLPTRTAVSEAIRMPAISLC